MRDFIKNEKVLSLVRKAMENKCITYEEINDELKSDFPVDRTIDNWNDGTRDKNR